MKYRDLRNQILEQQDDNNSKTNLNGDSTDATTVEGNSNSGAPPN